MNCEKLNAIKNHLLFSRPSLYRVSILKIIIINYNNSANRLYEKLFDYTTVQVVFVTVCLF